MKLDFLFVLVVLAFAGNPVDADCIGYAESSLANKDLPQISERIFSSNLDREATEQEYFLDVLTEYTVSDATTRLDPVVRLMLSYRAVELGQYNYALTNLELASVLVNQGDFCEYQILQYFIHAARVETINEIIGDVSLSETDLPPDMYGFLTRGAPGPFDWLGAANFQANNCVVRNISAENLAQLNFEILQFCEYTEVQ